MDDPPHLANASHPVGVRSLQTSQASSDRSKPHSTFYSPDATNRHNFALEHWIYDNIHSVHSSFKEWNINNSDIVGWFMGPAPLSSLDRNPPSAGIRLICREQEMSTANAFDDDETLRDIHAAMGIPFTHSYLMTHGSGQCGKYMVGPHQPCMLCYFQIVIISSSNISSIRIPSLQQLQHSLCGIKT
jgi:hypothetical protein